MNNISFLGFLLILSVGCSEKQVYPDTILYNGQFYTVSNEYPEVNAVAIKDGKILDLGLEEVILTLAGANTELINLEGNFAMPGFIEGHGHFSGLGNSLMNLNFLNSKSWEEIVAMVEEKVKTAKPGEWIIGRGWHQEKWQSSPERTLHGYPFHYDLSEISKNNPVMLRHASGHGLFANEKAMELAGISIETPNPKGGEIVRDASGNAIGVFEEKAMRLINDAYQEYLATLSPEDLIEQWRRGIELAEQECLKKGITSFQDAGASYDEIDRYRQMAQKGELDLRLWTMVRLPYDQLESGISVLPLIDIGDKFFTCRAIKADLDGALGAFGAWLLEPYEDRPGFTGQNTTPMEEVINISSLAARKGLQLCVHAIGDKANREVLNIFENQFLSIQNGTKLRWRIEHAQHLSEDDIPRFAQLGVIPSMQAIHCTSDAPFVEKRLGKYRAKTGAYPWRSLLDAGAVVTNGTDAPVEDVDPIPSFYASITRKRYDQPNAFYPEQSMTREEAIYSYTKANAFAAFEDSWKGSLEPGMVADIVVLSNHLLTCSEEEIPNTRVLLTIVNGKIKYSASSN
jgi:predicted amidohydrolase YtcJ